MRDWDDIALGAIMALTIILAFEAVVVVGFVIYVMIGAYL